MTRKHGGKKRALKFFGSLVGIGLDFVPMGNRTRTAVKAAIRQVERSRRRHSGRVMKHRKGE